MQIDKLKASCELMRKTGADDSQYLLVPMRDLEELIAAYELYDESRDLLKKLYPRIFPEVEDERENRG